jgi:hypothetical protein
LQLIEFFRKSTNNPNGEYNTSTEEQDRKRGLDINSCRTPRYRFKVDKAANNDLRVAFKQH